jgi:hypothetical protein
MRVKIRFILEGGLSALAWLDLGEFETRGGYGYAHFDGGQCATAYKKDEGIKWKRV